MTTTTNLLRLSVLPPQTLSPPPSSLLSPSQSPITSDSILLDVTGMLSSRILKIKVHEDCFMKEVPDWRKALADSADFSGKSLQSEPNGYESTLIDIISKNIFKALCHGPLDVAENLVGLHCWAEKMKLYRFIQSSEVRMIGICGIGGVGKTTVARAIYNKLYIHFHGCSFCEDVSGFQKKHGLPDLQKQLINNITMRRDLKFHSVGKGRDEIKKQLKSKKVLIFLDNMDHREQLEALAGNDDWFCPGSLIIVTSKDRQLLNAHQVKEIYEVDCLGYYSGSPEYLSSELRLLCWHGYPFEFLPSTFFPECLVTLDMSYSRIKELWSGTKCLESLINMKLRHCRNLTATVDFTKIPNLKELDLEGCTSGPRGSAGPGYHEFEGTC